LYSLTYQASAVLRVSPYAYQPGVPLLLADMLYKSMNILSKYPKQVIVLKSTQIVCGLSGREAGLQRRLIDQRQTRGFADYAKYVAAARGGNKFLQVQLLDHARQARLQMDRILSDAQDFGEALEGIEQQFKSGQVQIIRKGSLIPLRPGAQNVVAAGGGSC
jgi:hypothetical protein